MRAAVALVVASLSLLPCAAQDPQAGPPGGRARLAGGGMPGAGATPGGASGPAGVTALAAAPAVFESGRLAIGGDQQGGVFFVVRDPGRAGALVREPVGKLPGPVAGVAWSRGEAVGEICWALEDSGDVWKLVGDAEPKLVARDPVRAGALALCASPDGALLATAGVDGVIRLWSCADGLSKGELEGHAGPVSGLTWTADALWSVGWDCALRAWDVDARASRGKAKGKPLTLGTRELSCVIASPDGKTLVVLGHDGEVNVVDAQRRRAAALPERLYQEYARAAAFTPDASRVVLALPAEGAIGVLDPAHPERAAVTTDDAHSPSVVVFGPDFQLIVGHFDGTFDLPRPPGLNLPPESGGPGGLPGGANGANGANGSGPAGSTTRGEAR